MSDSVVKLIVTADDFGIGVETSRGIIRAHLDGPVTCTSLMTVTGDHVQRSVPLLEGAPELEVGLHLVFSGSDCPLSAMTRASGLLSRDGTFLPMPRLMLRAMTRRIDADACFDEIAEQAGAFVKLLGRPPAYVDAHHHAHQLPGIREALIRAMDDGILPRVTRVTVEPADVRKHVTTARLRRSIARTLGGSARRAFAAQRPIASNDGFFGMLSEHELDQPFPWELYFQHLPTGGSVEWVVHPGLPDLTLAGRDGYQDQRVTELHALTRPEHRTFWQRPGIALGVKSTLNALEPATH